MTTDQAVRLRSLLDDLENNRVSAADAAAEIRTMKFPEVGVKSIGRRIADSHETEVPPIPPEGSFHEVAHAFAAGRITLRQYEQLADAAVQAMREQVRSTGHDRSTGSSE